LAPISDVDTSLVEAVGEELVKVGEKGGAAAG